MTYLKLKHSALILILSVVQVSGQVTPDSSKVRTIKVTGHSHMDPVYRWRWNEMENREILTTFSGVLKEMKLRPELHFAQSSMLFYSSIQERFPSVFEEVRESIKNNKWSVVGGQWVEPDEMLSSGESLIRQFLIGKDYYTKNLGIKNIDIAWSPDVFTGHPVTLPKIYAGCGIKNLVFSREAPEGKNIFWWESDDGSRILAYKIPGSYNPDYGKMQEQLNEWAVYSEYKVPLVTIGIGDHGGGPSERDIYALDYLKKRGLNYEHVSPEEYFRELHSSGIEWPVQREEIGDRPNTAGGSGCYTSQAVIKKLNRYYENQLLAAEKFATIGTAHKGKPFFPREDFTLAWKILLFNQFHDILPGTLTGLAKTDVFKDYEKLGAIVSEQLNEGINCIGNRISTMFDEIPLVVYNPHSWNVSSLVVADLNFVRNPGDFTLVDSAGREILFELLEKSEDGLGYKIGIDASDIPAMGYEVYRVIESKPRKVVTDLKVRGNQVENSFYVIKWNNEGLTSIFSKILQREMLSGKANMPELLEDNGNSWGLGYNGKSYPVIPLASPVIIHRSPLRVTLKWEDSGMESRFARYMTLRANSDQIEFEMEVDWHSRNKMLRLVFPTTVTGGQACFDQPYGYVKREESLRESMAQNWIDLSGDGYGIALTNDGKYGFTINKGIMTMSVVRGARDMDPRMDDGKHSFKYTLIPHKGGWRDADIPLRAMELNQPLVARQESHHPGPIKGWAFSNESFPLEKSFFKIPGDHVVISSLKPLNDAYEPNPVVLRIVETEGRDDDVIVHLPYKAVRISECNHLEVPLESDGPIVNEGNRFRFRIKKNQIRSFIVQF